MPRDRWPRQRTTDHPRPPGRRRWTGRLGRGGVVARVLRVRHRRRAGDPLAVERYPAHTSHPTRLGPRTAAEMAPAVPAGSAAPGLAAPGAVAPGAAAAPIPLLPGQRTTVRRMGFVLVNCCTLASLSLGVLAILLAMRADVQVAAACVIACVGFDALDGMLARRLGVASPFGAQLDSLADMCAFGIAAPVVVYASVASQSGSDAGDAAGDAAGFSAGGVPAAGAAVACALVAACAAIRLARFNVSPKDHRFFTGVPTTMAAAVLAAAVLIELPVPPGVQVAGVALLAFAMVSSFPYATLARLLRLPPWFWLAPLAGALVDARLTFAAVVIAYLISGPVLWFHQRRTA